MEDHQTTVDSMMTCLDRLTKEYVKTHFREQESSHQIVSKEKEHY